MDFGVLEQFITYRPPRSIRDGTNMSLSIWKQEEEGGNKGGRNARGKRSRWVM
jgi:hypothetical protein